MRVPAYNSLRKVVYDKYYKTDKKRKQGRKMNLYKLHTPSDIFGIGYITKDGHTMLQQDVVSDLNYMNQLSKKVERLEKAIWEFQDSEYSHSPEEIQEYLDEIYTGKLDERFDKVIAECKKDWE